MSILRLFHTGFQVIERYRETVQDEEEQFQEEFVRILSDGEE